MSEYICPYHNKPNKGCDHSSESIGLNNINKLQSIKIYNDESNTYIKTNENDELSSICVYKEIETHPNAIFHVLECKECDDYVEYAFEDDTTEKPFTYNSDIYRICETIRNVTVHIEECIYCKRRNLYWTRQPNTEHIKVNFYIEANPN